MTTSVCVNAAERGVLRGVSCGVMAALIAPQVSCGGAELNRQEGRGGEGRGDSRRIDQAREGGKERSRLQGGQSEEQQGTGCSEGRRVKMASVDEGLPSNT